MFTDLRNVPPAESAPEPRRIRVPFLPQETGLGDAVKAATDRMGVQPCGGCQKRREALNRRVILAPWNT